MEVVAAAIEILHFASLDDGARDHFTGAECLLQDVATHHVLEARSDERRSLSRLDVLKVYDLPQLPVDDDRHAGAKIITGNHCCAFCSLAAPMRNSVPAASLRMLGTCRHTTSASATTA